MVWEKLEFKSVVWGTMTDVNSRKAPLVAGIAQTCDVAEVYELV